MKMCRRLMVGLAALAMMLMAVPVYAQAQTGAIRGRVTDQASGDLLQGAQVIVEGTRIGTVVDRSGYYKLERVPAGPQKLLIRYLGYGDFRTNVNVPAGQVVEQNATMSIAAIALDPLDVSLQVGQAKALNAQQNSSTITNVVDQEQIEAFPDYNTAEALQRVPGVNISRGGGEGKFVAIRGTEPRLTSVTVDGQKLATPEDEERYVALDVISSNQLSGLEVTKALTSDMDADAIGGNVNLVSRNAFDMPGRRNFRVNGAWGRADLGGQPLYEAAGTYSQLFGGEKWGFSVSGNYRETNKLTHNNESQWGPVTANGTPIPFALLETQLYRYNSERTRLGFGGDLEFRPSETSRYYVRGMFNKRDDLQNRHGERFRVNSGSYQSATSTTNSRVVRALQDRLETQYITNVALGGEKKLGAWDLDFTGAYTYGEQNKDKGQILPEFQLAGRVNLTLDLSNPEQPGFTITNRDSAYMNNPGNYNLDALDYRYEKTSDQERIVALNLARAIELGGHAGDFKLGAKVRQKAKDRSDQRWRYRWVGATPAPTMAQFSSFEVSEPFFDGRYNFGPTIDNTKIRQFLADNRGTNLREEERVEDSKGDAYDAGEGIYSAYAQGSVNFGKLMLMAGLRDEFTRTDYEGTLLNLAGGVYTLDAVKDERTYNHIFPSLHARYKADEKTNLRFAVTSGIARANFFDLVPYLWVLNEARSISRGNSQLDPTHSWNVDLMAERYFSSIGVLSVGLFYKDLTNIIYDRIYTETTGQYTGFQVTEPVNGGGATLYGVEVNWQQQLSFLPGMLSGFGLYANYTYSKSEADLKFREWSTLPGQAGDVGNVALSYDRSGLTARISMNYSGELLSRVGETPVTDFINQSTTQWDFSSSYQFGRGGPSIYFNMINITDEPQRVYLGDDPARPRIVEYYGMNMNLGVKLQLN